MRLPVTMLVEPVADVRTPLATQLRERGVQVVEAASVDEACGLAEVGQVDVVIANALVGLEEGLDLGMRLHATPGAAHLPLVILTSKGAGEDDTVTASAIVPETCAVDELIAVLSDVVAAAGRR